METDATFRGEGRCLCGAVRLTATKAGRHVDACHCATCRRWSGGPLLALDCGTDVRIEGGEHVALYDSSEWAQRGFCARCGTHLFFRMREGGGYFVPVGLLEPAEGVRLASQIFVDSKPAYYNFAEATTMMTGAEVMAAFAAKD
ncbi:GFA family protein [Coralloluteibacterium thermophilus]|uniref:GFA family protein n=1 Tax=Coralloluteibacterium thermophilum TaxID=2707049 RepID=A0ABV9NMS0_9GAMM